MAPINQRIAENAKALLDERGMTQEALAEATGIAERTLKRRLSGRSRWNTDDIVATADALGVSAEDLLRESTAVA